MGLDFSFAIAQKTEMLEQTANNTVIRLDDYREPPADSPGDEQSALLDRTIDETRQRFVAGQRDDGHFVFELEADATIPAEYILLEHYLGEIDDATEAGLATYLRRIQSDKHGGWPLFHDGDFNISASVKAYYALKLAGDRPEMAHMQRARKAILAHGGAAKANVFTRFALALFGEVPWRACPSMPVELMLLPRWFPFHMEKVSYWSRTVIAPLVILAALKPKARNPRDIGIAELFTTPPHEVEQFLSNPTGSFLGDFFLMLDKILKLAEPMLFDGLLKDRRKRAIDKAVAFITERLNGVDGLGGIFPAMTNTVMAFDALGYAQDNPQLVTAKAAVNALMIRKEGEAYVQPCWSPVWDTGLMAHALMEAGEAGEGEPIKKSMQWLLDREVTDVKGDWSVHRPKLAPGGWAFQYRNDHYPDVDDTAVVVMALDRAGDPRYRDAIRRATDWIVGMQSKNGGWGAFDADNTHFYLNHIPFADHGALLDPPTADVTGRCLGMLAQLGRKPDDPTVSRAIAYLKAEQEDDGSWFGRWGTNYIYGTWSVLCALNAIGEDAKAPYIQKAVQWLKCRQRPDGGWGEDGASYEDGRRTECKESTASQTAWGVLALMAAGEIESDAVERGIAYLLAAPRDDKGRWEETWYTAVGFPRVFYLKYHGYAAYFPLWALARYRNLRRSNARVPAHGI